MPLTASATAVQVRNLQKRFGSFSALTDVTFSFPTCGIVGLIGPNGAGKTTLLECLAGVLPCDAGHINLSGDLRSTLFYMPDAVTPWPEQSVRWVLDYFTGLFGATPDRRAEVLEDFELKPLLGVRMRALSKGQRKRVLLALALLTPRTIVLIDEPFEGLDLRQTREMQSVLRKHSSDERALLLSIHQISDAERICDRFILLSGGHVVGTGTLDELRASGNLLPAASLEEVFLALT